MMKMETMVIILLTLMTMMQMLIVKLLTMMMEMMMIVVVNSVTLLWEGQRTKRGRGELKVTELAGTFLISRITYSRKYCKLPDWHQTFVCKLLEICLEFPVGRFLALYLY